LSNNSYSQKLNKINSTYQKDTLNGRHFGDFIKPKNENFESQFFAGKDKVPTFKRKCKNLLTNDERGKCLWENFYEILRKKIRMPNTEINKKIDLLIKFRINKKGKIDSIVFVESTDNTGLFENEMIRVLKNFPDFEPGVIDGKTVSVIYSFPISHDLTSN